MPNITMCKGDGCPVRESCYRHVATPGEEQSYFRTVPGNYGDPVDGLFGKQAEWECDFRLEVKDDSHR